MLSTIGGVAWRVRLGVLCAVVLGCALLAGAAPAHADSSSEPQVHVPILLYHYIRVNPSPSDSLGRQLSVTPDLFAQQMAWLAANGYHPTNLERVLLSLQGTTFLPDKPVVLTFDDGYDDLYTQVYPLLKRYAFPATAFIPNSLVNRPGYITWDQLREMQRSGLLFVGGHTVHHVDLTGLTFDRAADEVTRNKDDLEARLGQPVRYFAFPNGHSTAGLQALVRAAGYAGAVGTWSGPNLAVSERYNWPRTVVQGSDTLARFAGYVR